MQSTSTVPHTHAAVPNTFRPDRRTYILLRPNRLHTYMTSAASVRYLYDFSNMVSPYRKRRLAETLAFIYAT